MNPITYLENHIEKHPSAQLQDLLKLCYQAANGAEHLMNDAVRQYFDEEFAAVPPREGQLCEPIGDTVCRVHLDVWKQRGLPADWLYALFARSQWDKEDMTPWLDALQTLGYAVPSDYRQNPHPVHHSEVFRDAEHPAYRLVSRDQCRLIPILERMGRITAIDGRAASGKTTLASDLAAVTGASVIHMDDFFLPMQLRTPERLAQPGGNIDYDRFICEVLPYLGRDFSYRRFDCSRMALGEHRTVAAGRVIVEGSYSLHPKFGNYADLRVFSDVEKDEQMRRIRRRNPELADRFFAEWIPMEERYFSAFSIQKDAILVKNEHGQM